ncbi:metallophosphoesterase [Sansalvadorimonas sp. 2012CJ34-2]|uniref:Metallophosphoesterase n=1 Tax=Parendozoicomonas callyspongiae TaxID=2942213 RepID=A0ABT0PJX3_9GAMM|nr:metallophosphoesterase [Sansalvadorimonas sp. 2012CJ34-2]MCL6271668.1 metallophosphoesterase [Sansalvadorimonas sp. 2012CJ34-2]
MFLQSFKPNTQGRDFVIGDLHGMYDLLMEKLESVEFNYDKDRCFSCGDLIDRGPDSAKCISLIHQPWFFPARGNHEDTLIRVAREKPTEVLDNWVANGGEWHLDLSDNEMKSFADQLDQLPYLIEVELSNDRHIAICHAQFPLNHWAPDKIEGNVELTEQMQWRRDKVQTLDKSVVQGIDEIYCGHTIVAEPVTLGNTHFIDTGAYASEVLTLLKLY